MKLIPILALFLSVFMLFPVHTDAHVLLRDTQAKVGATFHLTPDDDPIAGETTRLYFDIQDKDSPVRVPYGIYELQVKNSKGNTEFISLTSNNNSLSGSYIFPTRGVYYLTLQSRPDYDANKRITMEYTLRVDRGVQASTDSQRNSQWAEMLMIASLCGGGLLLILGFNNRAIIAKKSRL